MFERIKSFFGGAPTAQNWSGTPFNMIPQGAEAGWWQRNQQFGSSTSCATVSACVDAYSQTISTLEPRHYKKLANGGLETLSDSALANVLHNPNDYQTRSDLFLNMVGRLMYHGNAYLYAERNEYGDIVGLHNCNAETVSYHVDPETKERWYTTAQNYDELLDIEKWVPARNMLHIRLYTPYHPLRGVSAIANCAVSIATNQAISGHQATFFNNMTRASGVLTTDMELNKNQMESIRAALKDQGQMWKSGGIPVLHAGMKFQPLSLTSQDAQLIEAFNMTVQDIARAFRVPLPIIGSYESATFNNVENLINFWLSTGLGSLLDHIELAMSKFFDLPKGEFLEFDVQTLLRTDFTGRIDGLTKATQGGLMTPNEARRRERLPEVPEGDVPYLQQQMVPLGWQETQPEPEPIPPPVDDAPKEAAFNAAQMKADVINMRERKRAIK